MKILIGVPCMDTVPVDYVNSLLKLIKPPGTQILHLPLSLVYVAREKIVHYAIGQGYDYVLFIDSDMVFPEDTLIRLLKHGKDIVSGAAYSRKPPYQPCFYRRVSVSPDFVCEPMLEYERGLVEAEGVGAACLLIKTGVFKAVYAAGQPCFFPVIGCGEDIAFCLRAREQGYRIYVDTTLQIGHIGTKVYGEEDFREERRQCLKPSG